MSDSYFFRIAELPLSISFAESKANSMRLIASFKPFIDPDGLRDDETLTFHLLVDDTIRPIEKSLRKRIKEVDTGNGITIVDRTEDGSYQFIIKDVFGNNCCLLIANKDFSQCQCALNGTNNMRTFGLNNALMLIFAFAGSHHNAVLVHASLVRQDGWGYAFTAKSGTGKSTQVANWLRYLPGCDLMNDDNPVIRIIDGTPYIYGSPWSGKTPCYRNIKAPLGAMTRINRSPDNRVEPSAPIDAFTTMLTACSTMKWDHDIFNNITTIIAQIVESTNNFNLYCRPDKESAIVCNQAISRSLQSR